MGLAVLRLVRNQRPVFVMRLLGIPLLLDWSWMPVIPLYSWAIAGAYLPTAVPGRSMAEYWALGLLTTLLLIVSVVAHELAHALVARSEGVEIEDITLYLFGGMARMASEPPTPAAELKIAVVGPGTSFALGVLFLCLDNLLFYVLEYKALGRIMYHLGTVNLVLATFNLLPGFPLDGGRVLRAILWWWRGDAASATRTARSAGRAIAWSLLGVGLYMILSTEWMAGLWAISIGGILLTLLGITDRGAARAARLAAGTAVVEVMRQPPVTISPETTVDELINVTLPAHRQSSFVVACDGRLHGIFSLASIRDLPKDAWPSTVVGAWMQPVDDSLFMTSKATLAEAAHLLRANGVGHAAVIDDDGIVVGSLDLQDLRAR
jgi:Zn-dependent protease